MKKIEDLYKNGNPNMIDAEKLFDANGVMDEEYYNLLITELPITPQFKRNARNKFLLFKENRVRYEKMPERLPTNNLLPLPIDAHEKIGEYETRHNIYLTIANAYNKAMEKIEILEARITELESK